MQETLLFADAKLLVEKTYDKLQLVDSQSSDKLKFVVHRDLSIAPNVSRKSHKSRKPRIDRYCRA